MVQRFRCVTSLISFLSTFCTVLVINFEYYLESEGRSIGRYVAVDIAEVSLQQFVGRRILDKDSKLLRDNTFSRVTQVICADMGIDTLTESALDTHTWRDGKQANKHWLRGIEYSNGIDRK